MKMLAALGFVMSFAAVVHAGPPPGSRPLTPERAVASPSLTGPAARGVKLSPDGVWVTCGSPFDLMLYPGQRHGIRGEDRQLQL